MDRTDDSPKIRTQCAVYPDALLCVHVLLIGNQIHYWNGSVDLTHDIIQNENSDCNPDALLCYSRFVNNKSGQEILNSSS